jgi:putative peptidoglycan lipid II flippase
MAGAQALLLRAETRGLQGRQTLSAVARMLVGAALLGTIAYGAWWVLDDLLGRALWAQLVSVGAGVLAGVGAYGATVWALGVPEVKQIVDVFGGRFRRRST